MGGQYINKTQVGLYMKYRKEKGLTQEVASAKVGISVRSGRTIERGAHFTNRSQQPRQYKTRKSPIDEIWETELEPMLRKHPSLQPRTLFTYLQRTYRDLAGIPIYDNSIERTLQRRVRHWSALNGPSKAVMFPQVHLPGEQGLSDFTEFKGVKITIAGVYFPHCFYHFRLVYSKWSYLKVIQTGESMQALSEGLQEALWTLGGVPKTHRTDSLSAAFKNLSRDAQEDITARYAAFCDYYGMIPTRNNKGQKHENGSVESSHGHLKNRLTQELLLRGSHDFESVVAYEAWVQAVVKQSNQRHCINFREEQKALQSLPCHKTADYEVKSVKVSTSSMITVKGMRYSLPDRLSGHTVTLHINQREIKVYLGSNLVLTLPRKYKATHKSIYVIDYRHVIHALSKKSRAFRYCQYRNELLPNETYRTIWAHIDKTESSDTAPKLMLRLLRLAADYACEAKLGEHVIRLIKEEKPLAIEVIESLFNTSNPPLPQVVHAQHVLADYDTMIHSSTKQGDSHAGL